MNVLITGANGFIGQAVCQRIRSYYPIFTTIYAVYRTSEKIPPALLFQVSPVIASSLTDLARNVELLSKVDCIIHLAARVHQMNDQSADPLSEFRSINTTATVNLAQAAAEKGVRRFLYLSSIKVNGEETPRISPYCESDVVSPRDPYGISKWEAEQQLRVLS